jgi:pyruvate dehydrogenase E2 component (dihydrolipoamide acetyltransferase)
MDVPSSVAGVVKEIKVALGDRVSQGAVVAVVELTDSAAAVAPVAETKPEPAPVAAPAPAAAPAPIVPTPVAAASVPATPLQVATGLHASPSVRQFARELGVDLAKVRASGPKGVSSRKTSPPSSRA